MRILPRGREGASAIGVAVSLSLHVAVLGGLFWWGLRDKPEQSPPEGLQLIWDQPSELALAAEGEGSSGPPPAEVPPGPVVTLPEAPPPPAPAAAPPQPISPPSVPMPAVANSPPPPPAPPVAMSPPPQSTPPLPPIARASPPPPPPLPAVEVPPEASSITTAEAAVRVPPLSLPTSVPPAENAAPAQAQRRASQPPHRQAAAARPRPAEQAGGRGAEAESEPSGGSAAVRGITTALSDDPSFPRARPRYPPASLARNEQGTVSISMTVGPDGRVQAVRIIRSSGHLALDEEARRHVLLNWRFRPAQRDGVPVTSVLETGIQFTLQ